jgi:hypothetical protein
VGRPPNIAAKLSSIREPDYSIYITEAVYDKFHDSAKLFDGQGMWERRSWAKGKPYGTDTVYCSSWWFKAIVQPLIRSFDTNR